MEKKFLKVHLLFFKDENWSQQEFKQFVVSHSWVGALMPLHFGIASWETEE